MSAETDLSEALDYQHEAGDDSRRRAGDEQATAIDLKLTITDPDLVAALELFPEGRPRDEFALNALRIGVLALKQARGQLDATVIKNEGDRVMSELERRLEEHRAAVAQQLTGSLREYFDPESGRFSERVERLVRRDGELEQVMRRQIGREDSELAKTLAAHLGQDSPLLKLVSPDESKGLIASLSRTFDEALTSQRERILEEFSLDNKTGALSRLVGELAERHGKLSDDLQGSIKTVVGEFSLDDEGSALSRLVQRVERAQQRISSEFSLDEEASALARMRRDLLEVLETHKQASTKFREEVLSTLSAMSARREEARRSTRHGEDFEFEVFEFIQKEAQAGGDVASHVGQTTGRIKNCKVGDCLVELGPESAAAGGRIVIEAKQKESTNLAQALEEIETARKNRDAQVGLYVFSKRSAPAGLEALSRYGNDVVVAWDAEDPVTDVYIAAGLSVARALCTRVIAQRAAQDVDFESIDRAVRAIEKLGAGLEEINSLTQTIENNSRKILGRSRIMREELERQITRLDERIGDLRTAESS
jgi:uncharacterized protein YoxC